MKHENLLSILTYDTLKNQRSISLIKLHKLVHSFPLWHLKMLKDIPRLHFYRDMLKNNVKDKIVLDVGAGSGILSHLALKYGAKKVYIIERDPLFKNVLSFTLEKAIQDGRATLLPIDAKELTLQHFDELPEIIVHEIFADDGLREEVLPVFQHFDTLGLLKSAMILPEKFEMVVTPVLAPKLTNDYALIDFDGFPLTNLSPLSCMTPIHIDFNYFQNLDVTKCGEEISIFKCNLINPQIDKSFEVDIQCVQPASHLALSMKIHHQGHVLQTSFFNGNSHWHNIYYEIIKDMRANFLKARFKALKNSIYLWELSPNDKEN